MLTITKLYRLLVMNVVMLISSKSSFSEKPQDFSQEQENPPTSQSQYLHASRVGTLTQNFNQNNQKNFDKITNSNYSGIQEEIYS